MDKAVILARGLGKRMRKADPAAELTNAEAVAAAAGVKAMIPIGRPFMDYSLAALAEAGYRRVCLVIGPEHAAVRDYYESLATTRIEITFAIQAEPLGTADAVAAAETFADGGPIAVLNSDNYYPVAALRALREGLTGSGLAAFSREGLLGGNIPPRRIAAFAVIEVDEAGRLVGIIEKPSADTLAGGGPMYVSMNCWRLTPTIFTACRAIEPSPRGELEIPTAVQYAIDTLDEPFDVLPFDAPVLDLSSRSDIETVKQHLAAVKVNL